MVLLRPVAPPLRAATDASARPGLVRFATAARIIHPFPTLLNVAATAGLAFVAAGGPPDGARLARMLLMMLFAQSTIGVVNDLFDRHLDAAAKPWKPLPSGATSPRLAAALAVSGAASTLALAATLGGGGFALGALGLACGLAYDAGMKRSVLSALPFMVAVPTLPLWVWVSLDRWDAALWWIIPLGALIGLSVHLANTLPDIASDAAHGVRGLAHRLGERSSKIVAWTSFAGAVLIALAITPLVDYDMRVFAPTIALAAATLLASVALGVTATGHRLQAAFVVMGVGAAAAAVGWLAAAT